MKDKGFVLITSMLIIFTMLGILSLLQLKTALHVKTTHSVARQMKSLALAETGISRARRIIADKELNEILGGTSREATLREDSRLNPIDPILARTINLNTLQELCDDRVYQVDSGKNGLILFRISNNPEESPFQDHDGEVVVRSFGIVQNNLLASDLPKFKNQLTILEAGFRKINAFMLPSPLVFNDPEGRVDFLGSQFEIRGGDIASVVVLGANADQFADEIKQKEKASLSGCFKAAIPVAAAGQSCCPDYPNLKYLSSPDFWQHFDSHIAEFAISITDGNRNSQNQGLMLCSGISPLQGNYSGILVTRGNVNLLGNFSLSGLLLHLGGGVLSLSDDCRIKGALLYAAGNDNAGSALHIGGRLRLSYSRAALKDAGRFLPVTHLGTRIIYE